MSNHRQDLVEDQAAQTASAGVMLKQPVSETGVEVTEA